MLKIARQNQIKRLIEEASQISVAELSALLNVSEATIRRDLDELARSGWVKRTHGGAVRVERVQKEPSINQRMEKQAAEKQRIGRMAAGLIQNGEAVFLGSGSTVQFIVPHLLALSNLMVITNSLNVVNQLAHHDHIELIVIGGMLQQNELSMVGHVAVQDIGEFRADCVFMGIQGIDSQQGLTGNFLPETMTDRAVLEIAPRRVIVADSSKLGRIRPFF